ncbi:hypothetical protein HMPREF1554_02264 [Porphyromonas gingivalis F0569]|nr:hypothetical protein HMPREF1554_02264 [Porphyromonas gingivalis F0569]
MQWSLEELVQVAPQGGIYNYFHSLLPPLFPPSVLSEELLFPPPPYFAKVSKCMLGRGKGGGSIRPGFLFK